jgi:CubicO group peptidase (beta-lactamase class C family)
MQSGYTINNEVAEMKTKTNLFFVFLTIFCLGLSACAAPPPQLQAAKTPFIWPESTSLQQGLDDSRFTSLTSAVQENYPNIFSLLVVKNGTIVYEKYNQGQRKDNPTHVFSVTKSVTSALVGIALQKGYLKSVDQKISEFLPEYFSDPALSKKKEITIRQALTMTAGLEPADGAIDTWMQSADWFQYALNLPLVNPPGTKFAYNTALTHLLSGVLTRATGMSTRDFADRFLFGPLQIKNYKWDTDPKGYYGGGHLLYLTPRDMAEFGSLYLQQGKWQDQQIVPRDWVAVSTQKQVKLDDMENYGYLWWLFELQSAPSGKTVPAFAARGFGGQHIIVIPELETVVVITSNYVMHSRDGSDPSELVAKYILPALQ